jgi:alpha-beta hydrolase superfamily lysophospholipase
MTQGLVRTRTEDDVRLDGVLQLPPSEADRCDEWPADLVMLVHGTSGNFYEPGILEHVAAEVAASGTPVLRINTRGHDGLVGRRGGAALENIDECRLDLQAWISWARENGSQQVILVGHSMGGVKSIYATAAMAVDPLGVIAISPPRFCHSMYQQHPDAAAFREDYARASELVAQDRGDELMQVRQPLPIWIRAAGYIEKYGPEDRYDLVKHLPQVGCPVLVLVGGQTVERSPAFSSLPDDLASLDLPAASLSIEVIPDANMHYTNDPHEPLRRAVHWCRTLPRAS